MNKQYEERKKYFYKKIDELMGHMDDWQPSRIKKRTRRLKQYKEAAESRREIKNEVI